MKVRDGQNLADIAIQEYGCLEAIVDLARYNGISITENLKSGMDLKTPPKIYNMRMMNYCKARNIAPATVHDASGGRLGIFSKQFSKEFR